MVTLKPTNNKNLPTIKLGRSEIESVNSLPKIKNWKVRRNNYWKVR